MPSRKARAPLPLLFKAASRAPAKSFTFMRAAALASAGSTGGLRMAAEAGRVAQRSRARLRMVRRNMGDSLVGAADANPLFLPEGARNSKGFLSRPVAGAGALPRPEIAQKGKVIG